VRRLLLIAALPLALAACNNSTPPAQAPANPPAAQTPAQAPAAQPKPATEQAAAPLFGNWAASPEACTAPIVISAKRFEGAENSCDITALDDNGDGSFTATMSCTSTGQTSNERVSMLPVFGPQGEGIIFSYPDRSGVESVSVFRCGK
jgi:hypothetical protein